MTECKGTIHLFEIEEGEVVPRNRRCLCDRYTWGWMDDQLAFTEMLEAGASGRS